MKKGILILFMSAVMIIPRITLLIIKVGAIIYAVVNV